MKKVIPRVIGKNPSHSFFTLLIYSEAQSPYKSLLHSITMVLVGAAATAKSLKLCPTLCDPIDSSPPGSPIPGILQARILEWVAISFSSA